MAGRLKIPVVILSIGLGVGGYLWVQHYIEENTDNADQNDSSQNQSNEGENSGEQEQEPDTTVTYDEPPAYEGAGYFIKQPKIQDQQAYIAIPLTYDSTDLPTIVIYSHGSDTTITTSLDSDFMEQMQDYGEFFTDNNYIFAASAMHGANWGSDAAVEDMLNLANWIQASYPSQEKVDLLGFSMGGWPMFKFAFAHPAMVSHIASLAGTTKPSSWTNAQIQTLKPLAIKIWHGDDDVNVPYSLSQKFVSKCEDNGVVVTLRTVEDATHYDVDWEYHQEVLEFFET